MKCPNKDCRRETTSLVTRFDRDGKKHEGCPTCVGYGKHEHVYTARKFWTGEEVYGAEKNHEMNQEWGQKLLESAERKQRRGYR